MRPTNMSDSRYRRDFSSSYSSRDYKGDYREPRSDSRDSWGTYQRPYERLPSPPKQTQGRRTSTSPPKLSAPPPPPPPPPPPASNRPAEESRWPGYPFSRREIDNLKHMSRQLDGAPAPQEGDLIQELRAEIKELKQSFLCLSAAVHAFIDLKTDPQPPAATPSPPAKRARRTSSNKRNRKSKSGAKKPETISLVSTDTGHISSPSTAGDLSPAGDAPNPQEVASIVQQMAALAQEVRLTQAQRAKTSAPIAVTTMVTPPPAPIPAKQVAPEPQQAAGMALLLEQMAALQKQVQDMATPTLRTPPISAGTTSDPSSHSPSYRDALLSPGSLATDLKKQLPDLLVDAMAQLERPCLRRVKDTLTMLYKGAVDDNLTKVYRTLMGTKAPVPSKKADVVDVVARELLERVVKVQ